MAEKSAYPSATAPPPGPGGFPEAPPSYEASMASGGAHGGTTAGSFFFLKLFQTKLLTIFCYRWFCGSK